ncbi:MAG: bglA 1 [Mucilaginibacter sp.]|nr:bglA 1 [Mucilaginibacter sp.]
MLLATVLTNCKKTNNNTGGEGTPPANLIISNVVNTNNSGNVTFTAAATNAATYYFDFGDGAAIQSSTTGTIIYKYSSSGMYTATVTAKSSTGQTVFASTQAVVTVTLALVWSEEFNTDGAPDPAKWSYDLGGGGWGNNELEYYTNRADNAIVSNGTLKITAKKEFYSGSNYTSARLVTNGKYSFKYGRMEVRAKLPTGAGLWPAIWTLGADYATNIWPACGEMDVMEQKGSDMNRIYGTLHYPNHSGANGDGATTVITGATTDFHIYSLDWTPQIIKISVDGVVFKTVINNSGIPFNHNFFIILNLAVGGGFAGAVDPNFSSSAMEVDYIRVYQ